MWQDLETRVRKVAKAQPASTVAQKAVQHLDAAAKHSLRERRNDVVHGSWWTYDGTQGRLSRWRRNSDGYTTMFPLSLLKEIGDRLTGLSIKLNAEVEERWASITLPSHDQGTGSSAFIR